MPTLTSLDPLRRTSLLGADFGDGSNSEARA